jgi:hypothetical protein
VTSPFLLHGPSARAEAVKLAATLGRLLRPPIGDEGLKIADSRDIVELLDNSPLGDAPGVIIVGPLCRASPATTDVLLKTIEEVDPARVRPVFWATSDTEVSATVRSRCLLRWCPGVEETNEALLASVRTTLRACLESDVASIIESTKGCEVEPFLRAFVQALAEHGNDTASDRVWLSVRRLLRHREPTLLEFLAALLPEAS